MKRLKDAQKQLKKQLDEQRAKARKDKEDYMKGYSKLKVDLELKEKDL